MKNVLILILALITIPLLARSEPATFEDLVYLTEHYPPHNFQKNGKLEGISIDVIEAIWKELGVKLHRDDIKLVPWARGYKKILNSDNVVLFGMGYSEERAALLHWVGPYHSHNWVLIAQRDSGITLSSLEEAREYRIGVVRDDIGEQILLSGGFDSKMLDRSNNMDSLLKKLQAGRIDMISYIDDIFFVNIERLGMDKDNFHIIYYIKELRGGYGFSKNVPIELVNRFQQALDKLIESGIVEKIKSTYKK